MRLSLSIGFALLSTWLLVSKARADETCRIAAPELLRAQSGDPGDVVVSRTLADGLARATVADRARVAAGELDVVGIELDSSLRWASSSGAMIGAEVAELATRLWQLDCALQRGAYAHDRALADRLFAAIADGIAPFAGGGDGPVIVVPPPSLVSAPAPSPFPARPRVLVSQAHPHRTSVARIAFGSIMLLGAAGALVGAGYVTDVAVGLAQPCSPQAWLCFNDLAPLVAAVAATLYAGTIALTAGGAALVDSGRRERGSRVSVAPTGLGVTF